MRFTPLIVAGLLAAPAGAFADDSHDLRALLENSGKHEVDYAVVEKSEDIGKDSGILEGYKSTRTVKVLGVDRAGRPDKVEWIYHELANAKGESLLVDKSKKLSVELMRRSEGWRIKAATKGLPDVVYNHAEKRAEAEPHGTAELEERLRLLPVGEVAPGTKWSIEKKHMLALLGMTENAPGLVSVTGGGEFKGTKTQGSTVLVEMVVRVELVMNEMEGLKCPEPVKTTVRLEYVLPTDGSPRGSFGLSVTAKGSLQLPDRLLKIDRTRHIKIDRSPPK